MMHFVDNLNEVKTYIIGRGSLLVEKKKKEKSAKAKARA